MTTTTPDIGAEVAVRYLACWNETDPAARKALIEAHWSANASYTDPLAQARGRDEIEATIAAVQAQFPDFVFSAVGPADTHHNLTRFTWNLGPVGAEAPIVGFDVIVTDNSHRIDTVHGFLDRVPG